MKFVISAFLTLVLVSCALIPPIKDKLYFSDIKGSWESTGYFHYMKLDFVKPETSILTLIVHNQKMEEIVVENILFNEAIVSFQGIRKGDSEKELLFSGSVMGNRLILFEENSKNDVLSFIRQTELTKLRNMSMGR